MIKYETDSRRIKNGQIFVAIKGKNFDGHKFIDDAIKKGAIKVIGTEDLELSVPYEKVDNAEEYIKEHIYEEYKDIVNNLDFIGVTGTNGKTTTCYLTYQLLNLLNIKTAYIGTIGFQCDDEIIELDNTTPDIITFYSLLLKAHEHGCKTVVMEVSSHALEQERIFGIKFNVAGFTNLTQDHLDFHGTFENYFNAKLKLLNYLKDDAPFITNIDDDYGKRIKDKYKNTFTYGKNNADYLINDYDINPNQTKITFTCNNEKFEVKTNLTSEFNVYNFMLALSLVNKYGISVTDVIGLSAQVLPPKGRCETYEFNKAFVVIDYAHTPDAVEKIIEAYNLLKKGKVYTLVGCGGNRDKTKRPIMGEIATRLSDYVFFTSDNPRFEDPEEILNDITKDLKTKNFEIIVDRKEAVKIACSKLKENDILLLLGKGHENYQIINDQKIHFDDLEEVNKYYNNKKQ